MKEYAKHKGFTLVELLIVVAIIGILAAMMMMSSDEAAYSARAAAIITDMENIKAAAAAYYLDHYREIDSGKWLGFDPTDPDKKKSEILDTADEATNVLWGYLSNTSNTVDKKRPPDIEDSEKDAKCHYKYSLGGDPGSHWFVWCYIPGNGKRVIDKLVAREETVGLCAPVKQEGHNRHHSTESRDLSDYVNTLTVKNDRQYSEGTFVGICIH